jgi:hypothetical protein
LKLKRLENDHPLKFCCYSINEKRIEKTWQLKKDISTVAVNSKSVEENPMRKKKQDADRYVGGGGGGDDGSQVDRS